MLGLWIETLIHVPSFYLYFLHVDRCHEDAVKVDENATFNILNVFLWLVLTFEQSVELAKHFIYL